MDPEDFLPCSQYPANEYYSELAKSIPQVPKLFKTHFNIILPSTFVSLDLPDLSSLFNFSLKLTTHLHLVPRSKNAWRYTAIPPIHLHGVVLS